MLLIHTYYTYLYFLIFHKAQLSKLSELSENISVESRARTESIKSQIVEISA